MGIFFFFFLKPMSTGGNNSHLEHMSIEIKPQTSEWEMGVSSSFLSQCQRTDCTFYPEVLGRTSLPTKSSTESPMRWGLASRPSCWKPAPRTRKSRGIVGQCPLHCSSCIMRALSCHQGDVCLMLYRIGPSRLLVHGAWWTVSHLHGGRRPVRYNVQCTAVWGRDPLLHNYCRVVSVEHTDDSWGAAGDSCINLPGALG